PLRLPGLASGSVTVMSIKSKMMGTTLMSVLAVVYDGRREALTFGTIRVCLVFVVSRCRCRVQSTCSDFVFSNVEDRN
ncbi:hypothetical protein, partial [Paraburkholderia sp. NMBU_R16]|uniref:hypothetical protein n=1 Tax=Paraburkholderia sp. NMBU_R16 TaxID=2698676 RepID=UPI001C27E7E1